MKNSPSVSSVSNVSDSNTTSSLEVSSASVTVSTPTISVSNNLDGDRAVIPTTESEGRLNRMEDAIARLGSTLERFINNSSFRGYLIDFSVNASQSEIDGNSSDEEDHPQQRCNRGSRNGDINALLPAKETESRQVGDAGHQNKEGREKVSILDETDKKEMSEEEVGPAISGQLAEVAHKYWTNEAKKPAVVSKIMEGLKFRSNCTVLRAPVLNQAVDRNRRILPFHKRADKRLSDIQKSLTFATTAALKMVDEILMASTESRSLDLRQVMGYTVDSITLLCRAHKQISNGRKERGKDTTSSEYLFGENFVESMREAKENYRISNSIINTTSSFWGKHRKISHNSRIGSKRLFDHVEPSTRGSAGYSLNFQSRKKNHQHQRASHSSHSSFTSKKTSKY